MEQMHPSCEVLIDTDALYDSESSLTAPLSRHEGGGW